MSIKYKLAELGTFKNGLNFSKHAITEGCKIVGIPDFGDRVSPDWSTLSMVDKSQVTNDYLLKDGDILFVRSNGNKNLVGRTMIVRKCVEDITFSGFCIRFRPNKEIVLPLFLLYLLKTPMFRKQFSRTQQSNINNINQDVLGNCIINLPNYDEQKRIANIIDTISKKIENNNTINAELEKLAKTLYNYWFVQFDFPNEKGKPYRASGGKMEYNEVLKRDIPKGWRVERFVDIASITTGKEDANFSTPNGKYKFFTCGQDVLLCDKPAFNGQAILLAGNGDFNVKHYSGEFNAYQRTYVIVPKQSTYYATMFIAASYKVSELKKGAYGSIVKFITIGDVENIALPVSDKYAHLFEKLNVIISKIELLKSENDELIKLRDFLLPLLMNGQVKIRDDKKEIKLVPNIQKENINENKFQSWLSKTGLAARGDVDEQTLRNMHEAMDESDR